MCMYSNKNVFKTVVDDTKPVLSPCVKCAHSYTAIAACKECMSTQTNKQAHSETTAMNKLAWGYNIMRWYSMGGIHAVHHLSPWMYRSSFIKQKNITESIQHRGIIHFLLIHKSYSGSSCAKICTTHTATGVHSSSIQHTFI